MDKPGDWMENKQILADGVHTLLAYSLLITTFVLMPTRACAYMQAFILVFFGLKEGWYDLRYETGETWKSSAEDYLGYIIGSLIFWFVLCGAEWLGLIVPR
jgi:hypothetical protein